MREDTLLTLCKDEWIIAHLSSALSTLVSFVLAASAFQSSDIAKLHTQAEQWVPAAGDELLIDTKDNIGFLMHKDGAFISFPVVTGQRRNVWYIGRYYYGATPAWDWEIGGMDTKGDRVTFGPTGRFLRLFKEGDERTAYGIHGHRDAEEMLAEEERFRSMGCVIVSESILDILEQTYAAGGSRLAVKTHFGNPFSTLVSGG